MSQKPEQDRVSRRRHQTPQRDQVECDGKGPYKVGHTEKSESHLSVHIMLWMCKHHCYSPLLEFWCSRAVTLIWLTVVNVRLHAEVV